MNIFRTKQAALIALAATSIGCEGDPAADASFAVERDAVRIVEVLASAPSEVRPPFVELRNESDSPVDLKGWSLVIDGKRANLSARPVAGSTNAGGERMQSASVIAPHGLALAFDKKVSEEVIAQYACDGTVETTRDKLGDDHAASDDIVVGALLMQQRTCIPVFVGRWVGTRLSKALEISLHDRKGEVDRAIGSFNEAPTGYGWERTGPAAQNFVISPIGSTPGQRNFGRGDVRFLKDPRAPLPMATYEASAWRVGDRVLELRRQGTEQAEQEADALLAGEMMIDTPLVEPFSELLAMANASAYGSFFQLNHRTLVERLVDTADRGIEMGLTTDARYRGHKDYVDGFAALLGAGIPLAFDVTDSGSDRSPLSHNKFIVVDGRYTWTGSFNPIDDKPSAIHADNVVRFDSQGIAALHEEEYRQLAGGTYGTAKKTGVGGGRFSVDGAPVDIRFSPGISAAVMRKRAKGLIAGETIERACAVSTASGRPYIGSRFQNLDSCGGPYDLIIGAAARAKSSIYFVTFSLALQDLGDVMLERLGAGVDVRGVVDPTVYGRSVPKSLQSAGADIRMTPNSNPECAPYVSPKKNCPKNPNKVWLHHKFVIVDYGTEQAVVITGSHNISSSAEFKNDETLVVIRDRAVVEAYYRIFRETYSHVQTAGVHRSTEGLPGLAITEVRASANPETTQYVEITNVSDEPVALAGLELWNRRGTVLALESEATLLRDEKALVLIGEPLAGEAPSVPVLSFAADMARPTISPTTALVLREAATGRWIATFEPVTAEQNLPPGRSPLAPESAITWVGHGGDAVSAATIEWLGVDVTPDAEQPTWQPRGFFSDWMDEHHVTPTSLTLQYTLQADWRGSAMTPGF